MNDMITAVFYVSGIITGIIIMLLNSKFWGWVDKIIDRAERRATEDEIKEQKKSLKKIKAT